MEAQQIIPVKPNPVKKLVIKTHHYCTNIIHEKIAV